MITKRARVWLGIGLCALAPSWAGTDSGWQPLTAARPAMAAEGGEGGEGGEAGIDPGAARSDPVVYLTALDVVRAHYLAGQAAYRAGRRAAAQEMFVHPIAEVYLDFEPVLLERGAAPFQGAMENTADLAGRGATAAEVDAAVARVLAAAAAAEGMAPPHAKGPLGVQARVLSEFLGRAAAQYRVALSSPHEEPYLDGLGLTLAARLRAAGVRARLAAARPQAAQALDAALDALDRAYPAAARPATPVDAGALSAAVSRAQLALSRF
jgi:hypothetical protein